MTERKTSSHGHRHWWLVRISSIPLIPLFFYFLYEVSYLTTKNRMDFIDWVKQPVTTWALGVFILCSFFHACLGMEEIIIDYVSSPKWQKASLCLNKLFFFAIGTACLYAVICLYNGQF